jgi:RNA polymerase sigma factor for flagellar operon FliA
MSWEEEFLSNLDAIDDAARFVAARWRLSPQDAEELRSALYLKFIEDDYAVLRNFQRRCKFPTYCVSIAHRLWADQRMHMYGRFRKSAAATRLGPAAVTIEELVVHQRKSFEEAFPIAQRAHQSLTKEEFAAIVDRLPERGPARNFVPIDDAPELAGAETAEQLAMDHEKAARAKKLSGVVLDALDHEATEDRQAIAFLCMGYQISDIARVQKRDQKQLYRRIDAIKRRLREELLRAGFTKDEVDDLIGSMDSHLEFGFDDRKNDGRGSL